MYSARTKDISRTPEHTCWQLFHITHNLTQTLNICDALFLKTPFSTFDLLALIQVIGLRHVLFLKSCPLFFWTFTELLEERLLLASEWASWFKRLNGLLFITQPSAEISLFQPRPTTESKSTVTGGTKDNWKDWTGESDVVLTAAGVSSIWNYFSTWESFVCIHQRFTYSRWRVETTNDSWKVSYHYGTLTVLIQLSF